MTSTIGRIPVMPIVQPAMNGGALGNPPGGAAARSALAPLLPGPALPPCLDPPPVLPTASASALQAVRQERPRGREVPNLPSPPPSFAAARAGAEPQSPDQAGPRKLDGLAIRLLHLLSVQQESGDGTTAPIPTRETEETRRSAETLRESRPHSERESEDGPLEWRQTWVPLPAEAGASPMQILRRDGGGRPDESGGLGQRFVLTLTFSRLGPLQLDGVLERGQQRFDLILRAERALPGAVRKGVQQMFETALGILGTRGRLAFEVSQGLEAARRPRDESTAGAGIVV